MPELFFTNDAESRWIFIQADDRFLVERIAPVLQALARGDRSLRWRRFHNGARFTLIDVPGRSGDYVIVWEVLDAQRIRILFLGRAP